MAPIDTVNGPAQKIDPTEQRKSPPKGEQVKRTSAELLALWDGPDGAKATWNKITKRPAATCNETMQRDGSDADLFSALDHDAREAVSWRTTVVERRRRLTGLPIDGVSSYADRLADFKGINLVIDGEMFDGVALASALRNRRKAILHGTATTG
jgi:hypothetical protein